MLCNYVYETCTTVPTFCTGYTYVATYICEALHDNTQIHVNCNFLLTFKTHVHALCSLQKEGFLLATDTAMYIASTYIRTYSIHTKLTKNACYKYDIANWFMHARFTVYVHSYSYILPC